MRLLPKNESSVPDKELVDLYKKSGDTTFIGELYKRHMHFVFCVCLKYLKNPENAEEAAMQIFEKLIDNLRRFDVENLKSWLHTVAKNHCLIQLRNESNQLKKDNILKKEWPDFVENDDLLNHDSEIDKEMLLIYLEECLKSLKSEQKSCVEMFYLQELSYVDVSEKTGYDMNKVKSYIQNGKRNLKICIDSKNA